MSFAFAQHLQDFGSPDGSPQLIMMPDLPRENTASVMDVSVDVEAEKATSFQEGFSAASQTLSEEHASQLEMLAQTHRDELVKKEDEIYREVSQELMSGLAVQIDQVSQDIKSEVSVILMQIIEEDLVRKSIEQLEEILKRTLKESPNSKIDISGPNILLEKIKASLGEELNHINLAESQSAELTVEIDQSILKTRLFEWHQNFGDKLP